jgi:hypothetical protein
MDGRTIETWTDLGFYTEEWQLNLSRIRISQPDRRFDTKISTVLFADYLQLKDTVIFIVEPCFDYANSVYGYELTSAAVMYISNYMYLTKIAAVHLQEALQKEFGVKKIDSKRFNAFCKKHEDSLRKRLFKYKFETNGGNSEEAMLKWNERIYKELYRE